jgi:hypothetical protein
VSTRFAAGLRDVRSGRRRGAAPRERPGRSLSLAANPFVWPSRAAGTPAAVKPVRGSRRRRLTCRAGARAGLLGRTDNRTLPSNVGARLARRLHRRWPSIIPAAGRLATGGGDELAAAAGPSEAHSRQLRPRRRALSRKQRTPTWRRGRANNMRRRRSNCSGDRKCSSVVGAAGGERPVAISPVSRHRKRAASSAAGPASCSFHSAEDRLQPLVVLVVVVVYTILSPRPPSNHAARRRAESMSART